MLIWPLDVSFAVPTAVTVPGCDAVSRTGRRCTRGRDASVWAVATKFSDPWWVCAEHLICFPDGI